MSVDNAITVLATGTTVTTGAASARTAIPSTSAGATTARFVRIAATVESYIRAGDNTVVATTNDILVQPADSLILCVRSCTNIAYIQGAATGKVNIVALDDA